MLKTSPALKTTDDVRRWPAIGEWKRRDMQRCCFKTYDLTYAFYCKFPS